MRTVDLDTLKPEGYDIVFQGKKYPVRAMTVGQVLEAVPAIQGFRALGAKPGADDISKLNVLVEKAAEFVTKAVDDFPVELLKEMTMPQLNQFVNVIAEMVSAKPPGEGEGESPKPEAEKT